MKRFLYTMAALLMVFSMGCESKIVDPGGNDDPPDTTIIPPLPYVPVEVQACAYAQPDPYTDYWLGSEMEFCALVNKGFVKGKLVIANQEYPLEKPDESGHIYKKIVVEDSAAAAYLVAFDTKGKSDTLFYSFRQRNEMFLVTLSPGLGPSVSLFIDAAGNLVRKFRDYNGYASNVRLLGNEKIFFNQDDGEYISDLEAKNLENVRSRFTNLEIGIILTIGPDWVINANRKGQATHNLYLSKNGTGKPEPFYNLCPTDGNPSCPEISFPAVTPDEKVVVTRAGLPPVIGNTLIHAIDEIDPNTKEVRAIWEEELAEDPHYGVLCASLDYVMSDKQYGQDRLVFFPRHGGQILSFPMLRHGWFAPDGDLFVAQDVGAWAKERELVIKNLDGEEIHRFQIKGYPRHKYITDITWVPKEPTARLVYQLAKNE